MRISVGIQGTEKKVIITSEKQLKKAKVMDKSKFVRNLEAESSELR